MIFKRFRHCHEVVNKTFSFKFCLFLLFSIIFKYHEGIFKTDHLHGDARSIMNRLILFEKICTSCKYNKNNFVPYHSEILDNQTISPTKIIIKRIDLWKRCALL